MAPTRVPLLILGLLVGVAVIAPDTNVSASLGRSGALHVDKACPDYHGHPGEFCTITASNLSEITPGAKVVYTQPAGIPAAMLDSNVLLEAGDGNRAIGRCTLDFATGRGLCTFSDGTGRFAGFQARVDVTPPGFDGDDWHWRGTYAFREDVSRPGNGDH